MLIDTYAWLVKRRKACEEAGDALAEGESRQTLAGGSSRLVIETIGVDAPIQPVGLIEKEEDSHIVTSSHTYLSCIQLPRK